MKKYSLLFALLCMFATVSFAQQPLVLPLWPDGAPNDNGLRGEKEDLNGGDMAYVPEPNITVYRAAQPNGTAILMCPGGGYARLALGHEGHDMASWFNAQGITYVVLKYRMPNGHNEVPLSDAEQAMRMVRQHAAEWNIRPDRIGVMGASAGGHLAASLSNLYGSKETRPDFQILFYPVITMKEGVTHGGSRYFLLGNNPDEALVEKYSLEKQVNARTPEAFIMLSGDDDLVPPANGMNYAAALLRHKIPVSLHVYPTGGHGWGFLDSFIYKRQWTGELEKWLQERIGK